MDISRTPALSPVATPSAAPARSISRVEVASPPPANRNPSVLSVKDADAEAKPKAVAAPSLPEAPEVSVSLATRKRVEELYESGQLIASVDLRFAGIFLAVARDAYQAGASLAQSPGFLAQAERYL